MASIQILDRETLSNKSYPLQQIRFQKPDLEGKLHDQENEVYFRPDAATVLLYDEKAETFLMTRQFRLPTFLNCNIRVTDLQKAAAVFTSAGGMTEYVHFFTGGIDLSAGHEKGGGLTAEGEDIELVRLSFTAARQQLKDGAIRDAKTLILLQHFFLNYTP